MSRFSGTPAVSVQGARTLRASMKAAGVSLQDLKDVHRQIAETVKRASEPRAPRLSGRLVNSERAAGTQSAAIVRAGGARVPYAGPIHWGWPARHITANPWIQEAAEARWDSVENLALAGLEKIINAIEGAPGP